MPRQLQPDELSFLSSPGDKFVPYKNDETCRKRVHLSRRTPSSAAGPARETECLGKPNCRPGPLERFVRSPCLSSYLSRTGLLQGVLPVPSWFPPPRMP